jgi:hypothetical protein
MTTALRPQLLSEFVGQAQLIRLGLKEFAK